MSKPRDLKIARGFSLPPQAVTQTFAIMARRGAGKTTTSGVMVEEMVKAGLPTCVVDPIGVWYGLRSSADGRSPGLPVVILGGEHGDAPLLPTAGAVVAEMLVDNPFPVVLDLSLMSKTKARQFMVDFLETLYHRNRKPLHLVLDEADRWAPQRVPKGGERLLGACEDVVRLGRARGLGVTLISQRPAVVNKDVLSQTEVLIAMQVTSSHDRKALNDWIDEHVTDEERREVIASLPSLQVGTAWVCSPGWLKTLVKIQVRRKETFDSSATPEIGAEAVAPTAFAAIDLDALQEKMAETIERAAETDPKAMRRRIVELSRQLAAAEAEFEAAKERNGQVCRVNAPDHRDGCRAELTEQLHPGGQVEHVVERADQGHDKGSQHDAEGLCIDRQPYPSGHLDSREDRETGHPRSWEGVLAAWAGFIDRADPPRQCLGRPDQQQGNQSRREEGPDGIDPFDHVRHNKWRSGLLRSQE